MFIHDIIKINMINKGYLPDVPYHLITDKEMIDSFIHNDSNYFDDMYPCPSDALYEDYCQLKIDIIKRTDSYLSAESTIPDWVYSYMLGTVVSTETNERDLCYFRDVLCNNYTQLVDCWTLSRNLLEVIKHDPTYDAHTTVFGEPRVIRYLRQLVDKQEVNI